MVERIIGGGGGGGGAGGGFFVTSIVAPLNELREDPTKTLKLGDCVVFSPPLPRCRYRGGTFVGATDASGGVTLGVKLPSGLVIGVDLSRIRKASWLESVALQAD